MFVGVLVGACGALLLCSTVAVGVGVEVAVATSPGNDCTSAACGNGWGVSDGWTTCSTTGGSVAAGASTTGGSVGGTPSCPLVPASSPFAGAQAAKSKEIIRSTETALNDFETNSLIFYLFYTKH